MRYGPVVAVLLAVIGTLPQGALAQTQSGIAGVVKDSTGLALPGVTVVASSPALIERTQQAVTDGDGRYSFIDLRPGTYSVEFSLAGFGRVLREGVQLTTAFTATIDTELTVAAFEEAVTVVAGATTVDVRNVVQQRTISREFMDNVPTSKAFNALAALTPGMNASIDVGGTRGEHAGRLSIHGGRDLDMQYDLDGMAIHNGLSRGGSNFDVYINNASVQEINLQLGGMSAESEVGGVRVNFIPKDGGNTMSGTLTANFTNGALQSSNLTDELQAAGLRSVNSVDKIWDLNPSLGGAIVKDRLWFYSAFRNWGTYTRVAGIYENLTPESFVYTPNLEAGPAVAYRIYNNSQTARLTWNASRRNKVGFFEDYSYPCFCNAYSPPTRNAPEATEFYRHKPNVLLQGSWTSTVTNNLLFQAGVTTFIGNFYSTEQPGVPTDRSSVTELSTNFTYRAAPRYTTNPNSQTNYRASVSYLTGAHELKLGMMFLNAYHRRTERVHNSMNLNLLNGAPVSVVVRATPSSQEQRVRANFGLYLQDQWRVDRFTLNLGVRFDYLNAYVPAQSAPAGRFVPERHFAAVENIPNWRDISPRVGLSYDLFGDAKTALKFNLGRFVLGYGANLAIPANPVYAAVSSATRAWNDINGDFNPTEDELGPLSDSGFGGVRIQTRYDDEFREGFAVRPYNWEGSLAIQHELSPAFSVNAAYFRRWFGNHTALDNLLVSPSDYDPFCITAPVHAGLQGGGGFQVCDLYDIDPSKFGQFDSVLKPVSGYGDITEYWHGFDFTVNGRLKSVRVSGGISTGKTVFDNCSVHGQVDNPAGGVLPNSNVTAGGAFSTAPVVLGSPSTLYCHQETPFLTQLKLSGVVPLPWAFQASAALQNLPGTMVTAQYVATNAEISPSLGRNLAGSARTALIELIQPGTRYSSRINQLDVRLARSLRIGRVDLQGLLDVYNVLNGSPTLALNTRFGAEWLRPTQIMDGRLVKVGFQLGF